MTTAITIAAVEIRTNPLLAVLVKSAFSDFGWDTRYKGCEFVDILGITPIKTNYLAF